MPKPDNFIIKPKAPYTVYRKLQGYFCRKCQGDRFWKETRLCDCLTMEEDPHAIKVHINNYWDPVYVKVNT